MYPIQKGRFRIMNIRNVEALDIPYLFSHLQSIFGYSAAFSQMFVEHRLNPKHSYVIIQDKKPIAAIFGNEHEVVMHQRILKVICFHHLYTIEKNNPDQITQTLFNYVLKDYENRYLFTYVQSRLEDIYAPFGFTGAYGLKSYELRRSNIEQMDSVGIRLRIEPEKLIGLYEKFTKYFNGYFIHNEKTFENMVHVLNGYQGNYIALQSDDGKSYKASCRLRFLKDKKIVVDELIYLDQKSLKKILSFILAKYPKITIISSKIESFDQILGAKPLDQFNQWLVKLNQPELFSKLFNVDVKRADSALNAFSKPLFNSEFYQR